MTSHPAEPHSPAPERLEGKVGVFYRTSNRLGAPHHPTVMSLADGRISAVTADGAELFAAPVDQVTARFTRWGTIILEHGGELFRFVTGGYAGTSARPFTDAQLQELTDAGAEEPDDGTGFMVGALTSRGGHIITNMTSGAGGVLGLGARVAGVRTMFNEQHSAFTYSLAWCEVLDAAGVTTSYSTKSYTASTWTAAAIALPALAVFVAGVSILIMWLASP